MDLHDCTTGAKNDKLTKRNRNQGSQINAEFVYTWVN